MKQGARLDLIVLAADKDASEALRGVLDSVEKKERCRRPKYKIISAPVHDNQARTKAHELLRPYLNQADHALVVFDREGCGAENQPREELEAEVLGRLESNGWQGRSAVIVIDPELEAWVWGRSRVLETVLGWQGRVPGLRDVLDEEGFLPQGEFKPRRPKEAMEFALGQAEVPRSSSIFYQLATQASWRGCRDASFNKLIATLKEWFPS
jgi:hypothetical protein